ncbi:MAG TPA: 30S ribosomal protein S12 methylthiotransferase RimO [Candidatus Baltobacteraceae bacterium]|nr:30S ribosomal protein S12 methylthiotransferase RimO [Candidatus Baltobacteraceae bacterium]
MKSNTKTTPVRVGLISLGCAKNLVDAEIMLGSLLKGGMEITNEARNADVVIVNTCSFIEAAQQESVDAILESDAVRRQTNPAQGLIVSGCLPQRFRDDLPTLLPEVDAFMGIDQVAQVSEIVKQALARRREKLAAGNGGTRRARPKARTIMEADADLVNVHQRPSYIPDFATPRFRLTPKHFAYVKIAEGCNHPCSFCIIPRMRGSHRSRAQADIVREARELIASGVRELNLISQDSTYYGLDLRPSHSRAISSPEKFTAAAQSLPADATTLCTLLRELNDLPGQFWIRLLYTHPAHWTDELIRTIAQCPKVARYVDMPLQHIHENMLERMRRETSRQYIIDLIAKIRAGVPGIALRTTFIVGFPGETEEYFESLLDFIRATRFERLGVFTYSQQDGTRAAKMEGQVPDPRKKQRQKRAMAEQLKIAREISASRVGSEATVLVERAANARELESASVSSWEHGLIRASRQLPARGEGIYWLARGEADAPDIDGRVYIRGTVPEGDFARVKVIGHTDYDLIAEPG